MWVAILSAHINELRYYYLCAVPLGAGFLSVPFFPERKGQNTLVLSPIYFGKNLFDYHIKYF